MTSSNGSNKNELGGFLFKITTHSKAPSHLGVAIHTPGEVSYEEQYKDFAVAFYDKITQSECFTSESS